LRKILLNIMSKADQILVIEPGIELAFIGPFTSPVSSAMKLSNPSDRRVCFKIKTTAPKRYCVKPNSGVIDPRQTVQISVSLQPFEYDPNEKNKHKFMVQSMFAPDGDINQDTLWKETDANQLMDSKLKCVFVLPEENSSGAMAGNNRDDVSKSDYQSKQAIPASPKILGDSNDVNLKRTVEEIKRLQEETSSLRQENIQLKEESLRLKRLAASRNPDESSSVPSVGFQSSSAAAKSSSSPGFNATLVTASNPNANALSTTYIYAALVILILGVIVGKWVL
jgi:hypothetical protein